MTNLQELERIIRTYLRTGMAVVVLFVVPGTDVEGLLGADPDGGVLVVGPDGAVAGDPEGAGGVPTPEDIPLDEVLPLDPDGTTGGPTGESPTAGAAGGTAADRFDWGTPDRAEEFDGDSSDGDLADWTVYDGSGHAGQGARSPDALNVTEGVLTITGDATGTTGGMAWGGGQRYGRWEARVRAPAADPSYDAVLLLWPDADDFPAGGEIDFAEMQDPARQVVHAYLHHGPDNEQESGQVQVDATQWRHWAVEWGPEAIVAYVDGQEWFRSTDTAAFPPGPMHLCVQLDWFPGADAAAPQESRLEVDWVRQWSHPR